MSLKSSKVKYTFFKLLNNIKIAKGNKKIEFIRITTKNLKYAKCINFWSIIKYPKLNIIGEIIIIIELKINNTCWKIKFL